MKKNHVKILFAHNAFGEQNYESAWAIRQKDGFILDNILFYAKGYSLNDIISVEQRNGELIANGIILESGHSTIRILFENVDLLPEFRKELKRLGCDSELSNMDNMISVDVPPRVSYRELKSILDKGEENNSWEYQEGCLSETHWKEIEN